MMNQNQLEKHGEAEIDQIDTLPYFGDYLSAVLAANQKGVLNFKLGSPETQSAEDTEERQQRDQLLAEDLVSLLCRFGKQESMLDLFETKVSFLSQVTLLNNIQTYTVVRSDMIPVQVGEDLVNVKLKFFEEKISVGYRYHTRRLVLQWIIPSDDLDEGPICFDLLAIDNSFHYPITHEVFGINGPITDEEFKMFKSLFGVIEASLLIRAQG